MTRWKLPLRLTVLWGAIWILFSLPLHMSELSAGKIFYEIDLCAGVLFAIDLVGSVIWGRFISRNLLFSAALSIAISILVLWLFELSGLLPFISNLVVAVMFVLWMALRPVEPAETVQKPSAKSNTVLVVLAAVIALFLYMLSESLNHGIDLF